MSRPAPDTRKIVFVIVAVLLVAAGLRFFALGHEGVWCDEAYTAEIVSRPWGEMLRSLIGEDDAPPLFYSIQKLFAEVDEQESVLRFPAAMFGLAAVALLLRRWQRERREPMLWSAAVMAVSSFAVFYARQARSYTLIILLALVTIEATRRVMHGERRAGPLLALSGSLLCLTHHVGILLLMTSLVLILLHPRGGRQMRAYLGWHLIPLAVWAAYWAFSSSQLGRHEELNQWMAAYWQTHSLWLAPFSSLKAFLPGAMVHPGGNIPLPVLISQTAQWAALAVATGGVVLLGLLLPKRFLLRARESAPEGPWLDTLREAAFLFGPLIAMAVASMVFTPAYVLGRTDTIAYAAFVLLAGRGLARLPRPLAGLILLAWAALSIAVLAPSYGWSHPQAAKGKDREAARFLAAQPGIEEDWLVHGVLTSPSIEYYLAQSDPEHNRCWFPTVAGLNPAAVPGTPLDSLDTYRLEALALREDLGGRLPETGAVWIIATLLPPAPGEGPLTPNAPVDANRIAYPTNLLVYAFAGLQPLTPARVYPQDWMGMVRVLLRVPRAAWVEVDDLPPVQGAAETGR